MTAVRPLLVCALVAMAFTCAHAQADGQASCNPLTAADIAGVPTAGLGTCGETVAHGGTCAITCGLGYQLDGNAYTCYNGVLSHNGQTCVPDDSYNPGVGCSGMTQGQISFIVGALLGSCGTSVGAGSYCDIECADGYTRSGDSWTCANGVLSYHGQTCVSNTPPSGGQEQPPENGDCAPLTAADIANMPGASLGECAFTVPNGGKCAIRCNVGYQLDGNAYTCYNGVLSHNGQRCWPDDSYAPGLGCVGLQQNDIAGIAGALLGSCGTSVAHGSWCNIDCASGYTRSGSSYTCANGVLTSHGQTCVANQPPSGGQVVYPDGWCAPLTAADIAGIPTAGLGSCGSAIPSGGKCAITCGYGYQLDGNAYTCYNGVLSHNGQSCVADDGYSQGNGACLGLSASAIANIPGALLGACGTSVAGGSWCNIDCAEGYTRSGSAYTCANNVLTSHGQTCVPNSQPAVSYAWATGAWGACAGACGSNAGVQSRLVWCTDGTNVVNDAFCVADVQAGDRPASSQSCTVGTCAWNAGAWSSCSLACGGGVQTRAVSCVDANGAVRPDSDCNALFKPVNVQSCAGVGYCEWYAGDWSACDQTTGRSFRNVWCRDAGGNWLAESYCNPMTRPSNVQICVTSQAYESGVITWHVVASGGCVNNVQAYTVTCVQIPYLWGALYNAYNDMWTGAVTLPDDVCVTWVGAKPATSVSCVSSQAYCVFPAEAQAYVPSSSSYYYTAPYWQYTSSSYVAGASYTYRQATGADDLQDDSYGSVNNLPDFAPSYDDYSSAYPDQQVMCEYYTLVSYGLDDACFEKALTSEMTVRLLHGCSGCRPTVDGILYKDSPVYKWVNNTNNYAQSDYQYSDVLNDGEMYQHVLGAFRHIFAKSMHCSYYIPKDTSTDYQSTGGNNIDYQSTGADYASTGTAPPSYQSTGGANVDYQSTGASQPYPDDSGDLTNYDGADYPNADGYMDYPVDDSEDRSHDSYVVPYYADSAALLKAWKGDEDIWSYIEQQIDLVYQSYGIVWNDNTQSYKQGFVDEYDAYTNMSSDSSSSNMDDSADDSADQP